jgi:hypothetical protein
MRISFDKRSNSLLRVRVGRQFDDRESCMAGITLHVWKPGMWKCRSTKFAAGFDRRGSVSGTAAVVVWLDAWAVSASVEYSWPIAY